MTSRKIKAGGFVLTGDLLERYNSQQERSKMARFFLQKVHKIGHLLRGVFIGLIGKARLKKGG